MGLAVDPKGLSSLLPGSMTRGVCGFEDTKGTPDLTRCLKRDVEFFFLKGKKRFLHSWFALLLHMKKKMKKRKKRKERVERKER